MEYFPRKSLSKYLTDTIDFNKHVHDMLRHRATLQNYKATWTSLLTNEKAKSTFTGRLLRPNRPPMWALAYTQASKWDFNFGGHQLQKSGGQAQILVAKVKKIGSQIYKVIE
jgi:hypothetical protein